MAKSETKAEVEERREKTPDEITLEKQNERFAEEREELILERSDDRPLDYTSYPVPATSSWVVFPDDLRGENDKGKHDGHAVQVVQVHTYPDAPSVVTLRCDCSYEWRVTWTGEHAEAIFKATEDARKAREEKREAELEEKRQAAREAAGEGR